MNDTVHLEERFRQTFFPSNVEPNRFARSSDIVLFVHIPKTAGMSIGKALRDSFDRFHAVPWGDIQPSFERLIESALNEWPSDGKRHVIIGHYSHRQIRQWKKAGLPVKAASILRDPVARTVSQYNYNCSSRHPPHERFKARFPTLEHFVTNMRRDPQIVQMVGPFQTFDQVLRRLTRDFSFLGTTEHLGRALDHFSTSHGLPPLAEYHQNAAKARAPTDCPPGIAETIEEKCANERRLHTLLKQAYDA